MKKIIFILALFAATVVAGQVKYDSTIYMRYVNIVPVHWVNNLPLCDRLYARVTWPLGEDSTMAAVTWRVGYVPEGQVVPDPYGSGPAYVLTGDELAAYLQGGYEWLFVWLADSSRLKLELE